MRLVTVAIAVAVLAACDGGAPEAERGTQWTVSAEPDVVLESDAEGNQLFDIRGIAMFSDGSAAIMHASLGNVLFTDSDGDINSSFGRKGAGPGEFETPQLVGLVRGDSVSVWDSRLRRFHHISRDGGFRTYRPLEWSGARAPVSVEDDRALTASSTISRFAPGRQRIPQTWMYRFAESGDGPVLDELETSDLFTLQGSEGPPVTLLVPFAPRPVGVLSGSRAYLTNGAEKVIRVFDGEGSELDSLLLPWLPTPPVTDEMFLAAMRQGARAEPSAEILSAVPVEERLPAITDLMADPDGRLWIRSSPIPGEPSVQWWVIRPDGSRVAQVSIPVDVEVHGVSSEFIWGVTLDEYDVERVVRYPVSG